MLILAMASAVLMTAVTVVLVGAEGESGSRRDSSQRGRGTSSDEPSRAHAALAALDTRDFRRDTPGTPAVAVRDRGEDTTALNAAGDTAFPSASLAKVIVAVDILHRSRPGGLEQRTETLIRRSLRGSHDDAMNVLWSSFDGFEAVGRVAQRLGLQDTHPPADRRWWGETVISARDMVTLFDHVVSNMPATERELILESMRSAPDRAADGFDQSFGVDGTRTDEPVAAKKGWMCCPSNKRILHSAAVVGSSSRFIVVVLYKQPVEYGEATARRVVDRAAATILDKLS